MYVFVKIILPGCSVGSGGVGAVVRVQSGLERGTLFEGRNSTHMLPLRKAAIKCLDLLTFSDFEVTPK